MDLVLEMRPWLIVREERVASEMLGGKLYYIGVRDFGRALKLPRENGGVKVATVRGQIRGRVEE